MHDLFARIDARTRLAGNNKLEMLSFSLGQDRLTGRKEIFGINVFKVREVMRTPKITGAPDMPAMVEGMVSLRGKLIPVVDLARFVGIDSDSRREVMIVTEYNNHIQGFLVDTVDTIVRLDWACMRIPPAMVDARLGGFITAVTELPDSRLAMMLDVEKLLADMADPGEIRDYEKLLPIETPRQLPLVFCDDSAVARKHLKRTLDALGLPYLEATTGRQAWELIERLGEEAIAAGVDPSERIPLLITDVEMPEMDGYMLTRQIKSDPRFERIPVVMHSSLTGEQNRNLGFAVGADEYVSKFEPQQLAETLRRRLRVAVRAAAPI